MEILTFNLSNVSLAHLAALLQECFRSAYMPISKLGMKPKHPGSKKPFVEQTTGADLHRKTGKWMNLSRVYDRENDLYKEVITDPTTGEIVHECIEPLSSHNGHGSAKPK